jgi:hypothetical protein
MIVGHKIDTYLTAKRYGSRAFTITEHVEVRELHATKGWRHISHRRKAQAVTKLPFPAEWKACTTSTYISKLPPLRNDNVTPRMSKWSRPDFQFASEGKRIASLMRHRERRRDAERAANIANNKLEDQRLAGLR